MKHIYSFPTMKSPLNNLLSFSLFLITSISFGQSNTPYLGLGTNVSLTKLTFKSSSSSPAQYKLQPTWNQSMLVGFSTKAGFTQELEIAKQTYRGDDESWIGHRVEVEQIQARLSLGYTVQKKIGWTMLAGVYWGSNVRHTSEFAITDLEFTDSKLDPSDFGVHIKIAPVLGKGEYLKISPYFNALVGLKNLEGEKDTETGQITRLNATSIGVNLIYRFTK